MARRIRTEPKLPKLPRAPKEPAHWGRTEIVIFPKGLPEAEQFRPPDQAGEPPEWFLRKYPNATRPEWCVYWGLMANGLKPDEDFIFQAILPNVSISYYSTVDFLVPDFHIGIEVQGTYWHYNLGAERIQRDADRQALFQKFGIRIIGIDEPDALANPKFYVAEALRGIDHSRLARRF